MAGQVENREIVSWVLSAWSRSRSCFSNSAVRNSRPAGVSSTLEPGVGDTGLTICSQARLRSSQ